MCTLGAEPTHLPGRRLALLLLPDSIKRSAFRLPGIYPELYGMSLEDLKSSLYLPDL